MDHAALTSETFDTMRLEAEEKLKNTHMQLYRCKPIDIEFTDLTYSVPASRRGNKLILRNVSGYFRSGELTAILGPSGAGKSTLLSALAGYNSTDKHNSQILVNGEPRDMSVFRKLSRFIMQEDVHQACLTVLESMQTAADLKLGRAVPQEQKMIQIMEILDLLRLTKAKDTYTAKLSGGEKKRLSVALELVNNPPVLFLDEPTTGLDDMSSSQCIYLLKNVARGGRTVICSIHTPSARMVALFDNVYVISEGQCIYQGKGENMVPFLEQCGLQCPITYNPTDYIMDVSTGQYGNHHETMVREIDNGKVMRWNKNNRPNIFKRQDSCRVGLQEVPEYSCGGWEMFTILLIRMFRQILRDKNIYLMRSIVHIFCGVLVGGTFYQFGADATKTLFNFGFCFVSLAMFLFVPILPAVVWFPLELQCVKREYFNRWYTLNPYFLALTVSRFPLQLVQSLLYIIIVYFMTGQPLEMDRMVKFILILGLVCLSSEALGMAVSSRLNIMNGIFFGPAIAISFLLLAVYGLGSRMETIPLWIRIIMRCSYLRFGLEGSVLALYDGTREDIFCPDEEIFCPFKSTRFFITEIGMKDARYDVCVAALIGYFFMFKTISYIVLKRRLNRSRTTGILLPIEKFVKTYINIQNITKG